ncbi:hypothetical protein LCGC14_2392780, partial [marine sediment metagenome]
ILNLNFGRQTYWKQENKIKKEVTNETNWKNN